MHTQTIKLSEVKPRENSQRKEPKGVKELADSIKRIGLLNPIVIDEDNVLIAGGNRYEAYKLLAEEDEVFSEIPYVRYGEVNASTRKVIELEENVKRSNLTWKEIAGAVLQIDQYLIEGQPEWNIARRSTFVGYTQVYYNRLLRVGRALLDPNSRVHSADSLQAADNILSREESRKVDNETNQLFDSIISGQVFDTTPETEIEEAEVQQPYSFGRVPQPFEVADFHKWVREYNGPRFNLIHCDFPYGINHGKSDQGGAASWGAYEDSEDVYWQLINSLCAYRDNIMLPSCHIMFWLSSKIDVVYRTVDTFHKLAPELYIDLYPMVWHKSDNKGIVRQVEHTPRHIYETALLMTRGNRQIIKAVGDCYSAPTNKSNAIHISEKPVPVLRHFFQLFVDEYSEVLDPTCGSGTAIRAASSLGARRVVGLDVNEEYITAAQKQFENQWKLESIRKKGNPDD